MITLIRRTALAALTVAVLIEVGPFTALALAYLFVQTEGQLTFNWLLINREVSQ